ncbi:MAG TPA: hypothetical protein VMF52_14750 [Steroidobacteraceae bacterium]|nr:hypothetical protein [Steroidobacteraceae bacterium]
MQSIHELEHDYHLLKSGGGDWHDCIEWATERLRSDEENDDEEIALLASTTERHEALTLTEHVIARYCGSQALDAQLAAGKYLVALRHDYLRGVETVRTLAGKIQGLSEKLQHPPWLAVLTRNARKARERLEYKDAFDREFAYLARVWALSGTRTEFILRYDHTVSTSHDAL